MTLYEYNAKSHYAPYGKYEELITGTDLFQLEIVVQDDNEKRLPDTIVDLGVYKYLKHGDPYVTSEGYHTARSAYNFQNSPMALWEVQLNFAVHFTTSGLGISTDHLNAKTLLSRALYGFNDKIVVNGSSLQLGKHVEQAEIPRFKPYLNLWS